jgi:hypothetical protein
MRAGPSEALTIRTGQVRKGTDGWSSQGYPGLSGFAWYRVRLLVPDRAPPQMLRIPAAAIYTNYQVFADGKQVAGCSWPSITALVSRHQSLFLLTRSTTARARTRLLAIRVWHRPYWARYMPGGITGTLSVGGEAQIEEFARLTEFSECVAIYNDYRSAGH